MYIVTYDHSAGYDFYLFHSEENALEKAASIVVDEAVRECDSASFETIRLYFEEGKYDEAINLYNETNNAEEFVNVYSQRVEDD